MSDGPDNLCAVCGETPTRFVRADWPEPITRESDYWYLCRPCETYYRRATRKYRRTEPAWTRSTLAFFIRLLRPRTEVVT